MDMLKSYFKNLYKEIIELTKNIYNNKKHLIITLLILTITTFIIICPQTIISLILVLLLHIMLFVIALFVTGIMFFFLIVFVMDEIILNTRTKYKTIKSTLFVIYVITIITLFVWTNYKIGAALFNSVINM